ncbi:ester cyclase [Sulfuriflexus mobilis]|uniref:ester cyclase n=1 Tax=Sulfuriflexus mobilis TaxID=1811807 RepID=UPI000F846C0B|nr:ester cyclase [Sulfuriflexus mobilis]
MSKANKQLVLDHISWSWNEGKFDQFREVVSPSFYYQTTFTSEILNLEDYIEFITELREAIPGLIVEIEEIMSEGDRVMTHTSFIGAVKKPVFGLPVSDKIIAFPAASFWEIRHGKIKSLNTMINISEIERQIGIDLEFDRPLLKQPE